MRALSNQRLSVYVVLTSFTISSCGWSSGRAKPSEDETNRPSSADGGSGGAAVRRAANTLAIPSPGTSPTVALEQPVVPPDLSRDPEALSARLKVVAAEVPLERYDWIARSRTLQVGIDAAFRLVRDEIRFESYPGALRGPEVTYATRAGNAYDRSVLLASLLNRQGVQTQFAFGRLAAPEVERLFASIFEAATETSILDARPSTDRLLERVAFRAGRDFTAIMSTLSGVPSIAGIHRDQVFAEIASHTWVQAFVDARWIDLDTAFADATPGKVFCKPDRTLAALPDDVRQQVRIRVIAESLNGARVKRVTALEWSTAAEDLVDRQVVLFHAPGAGSGIQGSIADGLSTDLWRPVLWVDGRFYEGEPIRFAETTGRGVAGQPPTGGFKSVFGSGGALASPDQFVAEWIEFEIVFPGGRRDVTRRVLVDRSHRLTWERASIDSAQLRPLARDPNGITAPRSLHNIWFSAGRHNLAAYADAVRVISMWAVDAAGRAPADDTDFALAVWPFAIANLGFFVLSDHALLPALGDSPLYRFYPDSPRILIVSTGPSGSGTNRIEYDLRRDGVRGLARDRSADAEVARRKIWFGVLEGALEHETGEDLKTAAGVPSSRVRSTSALINARGLVVMSRGDGAVGSLRRDLLGVAVEPDAALILPRGVDGTTPEGWWAINAAGDTSAVLSSGLHGMIHDFDPGGGGSVGSGRPGSTYHIDPKTYSSTRTSNSALGPRPKPPERETAPHEYFLIIGALTVVIVTGAILVHGIWTIFVVGMSEARLKNAREVDERRSQRE
jgi:transglutaminase-like putative cysteine protease